ncbi:disease resistance protein (TIR-NBS-LRR class) [Trifolium pratense]|uniref:Disease resistance protein (TIR-NBS-LRR class) n=1 Tax=Trifolium pratense TaxID=57577 RepID=A0A2K3NV54_TRIPR|nr:disease resistance protein (TIR-NBS-LRR class) [Trifolium pratense]
MSWREVLPEAPALAGSVALNSRNDMIDLHVADNPVGLKTRILDMIQWLNIQQSNDIMLLGLWGMGGIGKNFEQCS